jgi:hypothetical protein
MRSSDSKTKNDYDFEQANEHVQGTDISDHSVGSNITERTIISKTTSEKSFDYGAAKPRRITIKGKVTK